METKIPTLEEVKEYFKNAKEVRCAYDNALYDISKIKGEIELYLDSYRCYDKYNEEVILWYFRQKKYAEIISYKEETTEKIGHLETPKHYDNSKGLRYNEGKERWSLVDFEALKPMVKVLEFGAKKYDDHNWKKGLKTTEISESLLRHLTAYLNGEDNDKETGLPHTGHIMCNAMFLSHMHEFKKDFDTRYKKPCCGNWDELGNCKCK